MKKFYESWGQRLTAVELAAAQRLASDGGFLYVTAGDRRYQVAQAGASTASRGFKSLDAAVQHYYEVLAAGLEIGGQGGAK